MIGERVEVLFKGLRVPGTIQAYVSIDGSLKCAVRIGNKCVAVTAAEMTYLDGEQPAAVAGALELGAAARAAGASSY